MRAAVALFLLLPCCSSDSAGVQEVPISGVWACRAATDPSGTPGVLEVGDRLRFQDGRAVEIATAAGKRAPSGWVVNKVTASTVWLVQDDTWGVVETQLGLDGSGALVGAQVYGLTSNAVALVRQD